MLAASTSGSWQMHSALASQVGDNEMAAQEQQGVQGVLGANEYLQVPRDQYAKVAYEVAGADLCSLDAQQLAGLQAAMVGRNATCGYNSTLDGSLRCRR